MWIVDRLRQGVLRIAARRVRVTRSGRVRTARGSFRLELYEASSEQTPRVQPRPLRRQSPLVRRSLPALLLAFAPSPPTASKTAVGATP
jgi:hypothetical protein